MALRDKFLTLRQAISEKDWGTIIVTSIDIVKTIISVYEGTPGTPQMMQAVQGKTAGQVVVRCDGRTIEQQLKERLGEKNEEGETVTAFGTADEVAECSNLANECRLEIQAATSVQEQQEQPKPKKGKKPVVIEGETQEQGTETSSESATANNDTPDTVEMQKAKACCDLACICFEQMKDVPLA